MALAGADRQFQVAVDHQGRRVTVDGDADGAEPALHNLALQENADRHLRTIDRPQPGQAVGDALFGRLAGLAQGDDLVPGGERGAVLIRVDAHRHPAELAAHRRGDNRGRVCRQAEPDAAIVAAFQGAADRGVLLRIGGGDRHLVHPLEVLHVDRQDLRRDAVRLADPERLRVLVDRHERAVIDGRIRSQGTGRQFAGLDGPFENAGVRARFDEGGRYLVAARRRQLDGDRVGFVGQIAVGVLDAQVDQVARLDLRAGPIDRLALVGVRIFFALELVGETLLVHVDDLAAGHLEAGVGCHANLGVWQRHVAELLLELLGIVAADDVVARQLQHFVALDGLAETGFEVGAEQALAGAAAVQVDDLLVAARLGGDADRDAGAAAADAEVAVLHHDRQRLAGRVPALADAAQPADRAQQFQLIDVALLGTVDLGQVVEHLVGQLRRRHPFEDAAEDGPGRVAIAAPTRQHAAQELGADDDVALPAAGQALETLFGLVVDLLLHERFADPEVGLNRLRSLRIAIQERREFSSGQVVALRPEVVAGQQQLHAGLLDVVDLLRLAVLDEPGAENILDAIEVLVAAGGHVPFADERQQIDWHIGAVGVK